jgi:hypothetical protein
MAKISYYLFGADCRRSLAAQAKSLRHGVHCSSEKPPSQKPNRYSGPAKQKQNGKCDKNNKQFELSIPVLIRWR